MGRKGNESQAPVSAEGQAYLAANPDVAADPYFSQNPYEHYTRHGQYENRQLTPGGGGGHSPHSAPHSPHSAPHSPHSAPHSGETSYEDMLAQQQAQYEQQLADQARIQGESDRDRMYADYLSAADSAIGFVTGEIDQERSNAALLGIDYNITEEARTQRISDYFASIWGEGQQTQLEALMGEWGNPTGFAGFSVVRGDPSGYAAEGEGQEETIATSTGIRPGTLVTEEEDTLGGSRTALGA